jgi:hypothetical protein
LRGRPRRLDPRKHNAGGFIVGVLRHQFHRGMLWRGLLGRDGRLTGIYARWHMFEEKHEAVMAIEAAVSPLMPEMAR